MMVRECGKDKHMYVSCAQFTTIFLNTLLYLGELELEAVALDKLEPSEAALKMPVLRGHEEGARGIASLGL